MPKLNVLVAYPYWKDGFRSRLLDLGHDAYRLIVDSGAFSAWNSGKVIELDAYCRFLDSLEALRPFYAVQLDVFGNPEATYRNFLVMKERGYDVMPVFTRGDSLERLDEFYTHTDYIMFGGIVVGGANKNYVKWFLSRNGGRKAHWLGFVNMPFIKAYRPESVDSSSWLAPIRFGVLNAYAGSGSLISTHRRDYTDKPTPRVMAAWQRSGIGMDMIRHTRIRQSWVWGGKPPNLDTGYGVPLLIHAIAHLHRAVEVEERLGTKIYLAMSQPVQLDYLTTAYRHLVDKGIVTHE